MYLCLNAGIFSLEDVIEGTPLPVNIVHVQPRWREGKPLSLQNALAFFVDLQNQSNVQCTLY